MSLKAKFVGRQGIKAVSRQEILDLAIVAIKKAKRDGTSIAPIQHARRLMEEHPRCPVSLDELSDTITRIAIDRRVGIQFGKRE